MSQAIQDIAEFQGSQDIQVNRVSVVTQANQAIQVQGYQAIQEAVFQDLVAIVVNQDLVDTVVSQASQDIAVSQDIQDIQVNLAIQVQEYQVIQV